MSSLEMEARLGDVLHDSCGWQVDLSDFDIEVLLMWSNVQVVLELHLTQKEVTLVEVLL